jgi:Protein of unknown function (DUF2865)
MKKGGKNTSLCGAACVLAAGMLIFAPPTPAAAQSLFESIFGGLSRALTAPMREPAPVHSYAEPSYRLERVINPPSQYVETGPAKAFCVRTCDGHYFPVRAHAGMSAAEACHAFCPASETRLYSGSTIDYASARDGSRYAALDTAYAYRRHLIAGCTCNGRNQFGLAHVAVATDPTLRPGDVVATRNGMVAFTGRTAKTADFTPVESYAHFSKSYRDQLAAMQVTPPGPEAPPATPIALPLSSTAQGHDRSASR